MRPLAFAVPGDLATPTGGYVYDRRMIEELTRLGWTVDVIDLGNGFPFADDKMSATAMARLERVPQRCPIVIDGLALGVLPDVAVALKVRNPLIAMVHHPLALESGLTPEQAKTFQTSERVALAAARRVIVNSTSTARQLIADYGVPVDRITVARPGNDAVEPARGSSDGIIRLLSVGSFVPRKGHDVLLAALATLADLPWRLTIAGDTEREPTTAAKIRSEIARQDFGDRITIIGAVPPKRLAELYRASDLFVLASRFEGYGMAYTEAIAFGLPVIGTTAGAIPEAVPSEAAILVAPDDAAELATALHLLIESKDERTRYARAARAAATRLPTWRDSAALFAGAIVAAS